MQNISNIRNVCNIGNIKIFRLLYSLGNKFLDYSNIIENHIINIDNKIKNSKIFKTDNMCHEIYNIHIPESIVKFNYNNKYTLAITQYTYKLTDKYKNKLFIDSFDLRFLNNYNINNYYLHLYNYCPFNNNYGHNIDTNMLNNYSINYSINISNCIETTKLIQDIELLCEYIVNENNISRNINFYINLNNYNITNNLTIDELLNQLNLKYKPKHLQFNICSNNNIKIEYINYKDKAITILNN